MGQPNSCIKEAITIALDKQVHLYSVDTKAFYTDEEMEIKDKISDLKRKKSIIEALKNFYDGKTSEAQLRKTLKQQNYIDNIEAPIPSYDEAIAMWRERKELNTAINTEKERLQAAFDRFSEIRLFREEFCNEKKYAISFFESNLTRTLGIETDTLTLDLIAVQVYYHKVFQDLIYNGFFLNNEKYVPLTASAGQTRKKCFVFIREQCLQQHMPKLMCGLTVDRINERGGVNIAKYLAYLALNETATDPWPEFDIERCIVVDDFETEISGMVDYIGTNPEEDNYYQISRTKMDVPIPHTDGCGMVLPSVSKKNFMVRLPWVKGLLASFPFDKFIREANKSQSGTNYGIVTDIYGQEHDVLAEGIQIIFTKSQFKMWKYYDSWNEYKQFFKTYGCEAGVCNMEEDDPAYARTTYQTLQTLTDLTADELTALATKTTDKLGKISSDLNTMLKVFGATKTNYRKTPFQKALMLYPELLQDTYCQDTLRDIKDKIVKNAVAGKLDIEGYYAFLLPDLYAFCQWLFLGSEVPSGLLQDGEVYCRLFESGAELDCLRSPHLYKEHAVRTNMFGQNEEAKRWFQTDGIYTSTHDMITKILMNDVDGDTSLVVADQTLVHAAKRNMKDTVPLYYELGKAGACQITPEAIYNSVVAAYKGSNIGLPSNEITKAWNLGPNADKHIELIKFLTMEANATVDYPKTLYKLVRPKHIDTAIRDMLKGVKLPHYFIEAKGKSPDSVAPLSESCVDQLRNIIPNPRLNFSFTEVGKFNWRTLTSQKRIPSNETTQQVVDTFCNRAKDIKFTRKGNKDNPEPDWRLECLKIRNDLLSLHPDIDVIINVLVRHLFSKSNKRKKVFWECFGQEVLRNIQKNLGTNTISETIVCQECKERVHKDGRSQKYCSECAKLRHRQQKTASMRRSRTSCGHS